MHALVEETDVLDEDVRGSTDHVLLAVDCHTYVGLLHQEAIFDLLSGGQNEFIDSPHLLDELKNNILLCSRLAGTDEAHIVQLVFLLDEFVLQLGFKEFLFLDRIVVDRFLIWKTLDILSDFN